MKYLIAIDLDGTLLNNNNEVSEENLKAIKNVRSLGHKVILATGRTYAGAINIYNKLNLDTPMVIHNGAYVTNPTDKTFKKKRHILCSNLTTDIITNTKPYLLGAFYTIEDTTYSYNLNKDIEKFFNGENSHYVVEGDLTSLNNSPSNIVLTVKVNEKDKFENIFNAKYKTLLDLRIWREEKDYILYEVFDKNISKYTGIEYILNYYNLNPEHLIAFGDNHNDVDMIKNAKIGVAVNNAANVLKKEAKYISNYNNNENAIANFLNQKFLNQKQIKHN